MSPQVSIVTPHHNAAKTLARTIASVQAQDFTAWELILVDDASHDGGGELADRAAAGDARIRSLHLAAQSGAAAARNHALAHAQARHIAFLDADDSWAPAKLSRHLAHMAEHGAGLSYTGFRRVRPDGARRVHIPTRTDRARLLNGNVIACSTALVDRAVTGDFRMPDLARRQDFATWLHLLERVAVAHGLDEALSDIHVTQGSLSAPRLSTLRATWGMYRGHLGLGPMTAGWHMSQHLIRRLRRG